MIPNKSFWQTDHSNILASSEKKIPFLRQPVILGITIGSNILMQMYFKTKKGMQVKRERQCASENAANAASLQPVQGRPKQWEFNTHINIANK